MLLLLSKIKRNRIRDLFNEPSICRYCDADLDGGDILQVLSRNEYYKELSRDELLEIAAHYGYNVFNPRRFSKEMIVQFEDKPQITICPYCKGIWPKNTKMKREYYI